MATTVCSKTISLKVWNADSTTVVAGLLVPLTSPDVTGPHSGVVHAGLSKGKYSVTYSRNPPPANNLYGSAQFDDSTPAPNTVRICTRGGGYGSFPAWPPIVFSPGGVLKGFTACDTSAAASAAACNAGSLLLEPLLYFDVTVNPTPIGWSYAGYPTAIPICSDVIGAVLGGDARIDVTRIGKL